MTWNVYELKPTGRTLLAEITGLNCHKAAKDFARDYMAEHGTRLWITKAA